MQKTTRAYLCLIFIAIVWGTTYLGIRVGVAHYPPFLFAGLRQIISAAMILAIAATQRERLNLSPAHLLRQLVIGFLMIAVGNGLVTWAEQYVPSGVAALICGMMPVWAVLMNLALSRGAERLNLFILGGMLLGICGVGLIFMEDIASLGNPKYLQGIGLLFVATMGWAGGSILGKKQAGAPNPVMNAGLQVLFGGLALLLVSPLSDSYDYIDWWNAPALWSLAYLIVFGSVLAYTAYMYALSVLPVGLVTTYAYVNPLVAVLLGYFLGEPLTIWTALAFVGIMGGVFLVNTGYRRQHPKVAEQLAGTPEHE